MTSLLLKCFLRHGMLLAGIFAMMQMLCGCISCYRYSGKIVKYPDNPTRLADFSIVNCDVSKQSKYLLRRVRQNELEQALGESKASRDKCPKVSVLLCEKRKVESNRGVPLLLSYFTFGILPGVNRMETTVEILVAENGYTDSKRRFEIQLDERYRLFWPFIDEEYRNEFFTTAVCIEPFPRSFSRPTEQFNQVLGFLILSGMTNDFKEGE